ncbi:hypothetical protein HDU87_005227 [Geranomyces variabilis]|uniref:Protein-serine/threonine kinase n=1 Tax=Geranomyces variabilis TaxID=109894 RepID=A0AAD5TJW5_9FUNG|nr:hypothetical protein HDU87_005227 [Geranomyces variabilis]
MHFIVLKINDFQHLPFIVGTNPHIEHVYKLYWKAFETFKNIPPVVTLEQNRDFCDILEDMLSAHLVAIPRLAMGIAESALHLDPREADRFMNEMLRSRIGRRVLAEQHITLSGVFDGKECQDESFIGIVNTRCRAREVVDKCTALVGKVFEEAFGIPPPEVHVDGHLDAEFTYIPDQIEYIIFELLKNSMWATVETHASDVFRAAMQGSGLDADGVPAAAATAATGPGERRGEAWDANAAMTRAASSTASAGLVNKVRTDSPSSSTQPNPYSSSHGPATPPPPPSLSTATTTPPRAPQQCSRNTKPILPPIRATIGTASSLLTFRISDQGGGIPSSTLPHLYSYSHPSKRKFLNFAHVPRLAGKVAEAAEEINHHHHHHPHHARHSVNCSSSRNTADTPTSAAAAASSSSSSSPCSLVTRKPPGLRLGLGLPMSKVYANYWGGDIEVISLDGYGVDAYVALRKSATALEGIATSALGPH